MAIFTPDTTKQIDERLRADVAQSAPDSNPYLTESWLGALIGAFARRIYDLYRDLHRTELRLFPDTADDETAPIWGNIFIGERNPETTARGNVVATGTVGSTIPAGQTVSANGQEYTLQNDLNIVNSTISVQSVTRSGSTVTVTTNGNHNLTSSVKASLTGADQADYNVVDSDIVVIDNNVFTYQVDTAPVTPATGAMTINFASGFAEVVSTQYGSATNLDANSPVQLQSPIVGVDDTLSVDFGAIGGGADQESLEDYKARYLEKIRNPQAQFNKNAIIAQAKTVTGVTRVFVQEAGEVTGSIAITGITRTNNIATADTTPNAHGLTSGQSIQIAGANQAEYNVLDAQVIVTDDFTFHYAVTGIPFTPATGTITSVATVPLGSSITYFLRDNDANPIPTLSEVNTVKAAIDEIRPVNTSEANNIVLAPNAVTVDFLITNLVPDTAAMRTAIEANLNQFFQEETEIGAQLDQDQYRAAIINAVDINTGDSVQTFNLSTPTGDIAMPTGSIPTLGTVSFS